MKKLMLVVMMMGCLSLFAESIKKSDSKLVEMIFTVPLQDLVIEANQIFIDFEGERYIVRQLERKGESWKVKAIPMVKEEQAS